VRSTEDVTVGRIFGGDQVPVVVAGLERGALEVSTVDLTTGSLQDTPAVPVDGWITEIDAAGSDKWTVLSLVVCENEPLEADTGRDCPDQGASGGVVYILAEGADEWIKVAAPPSAPLIQTITEITGDSALLDGFDPNFNATRLALALSSGTASVAKEAATTLVQCNLGQRPALTFDSYETPTRAEIPGEDGSVAIVDLPDDLRRTLRQSLSPALDCGSANGFVVVPGQDASQSGADLPTVPEGGLEGEPETTVQRPSETYVYDLSHLDRQPVVIPANDFEAIAANGDRWALSHRDTFSIFDPSTGRVSTIERKDGATIRLGSEGYLVVSQQVDGGALTMGVARYGN
jgi:hypothetical protein